MAALRFPTVRDLYDTFPTAQDDVGIEASDEPSLKLLQSLAAKGSWRQAVSFCAYLLPRREAVWWGCQSLRRMQPRPSPAEIAAIEAAETWVRTPEENCRREALSCGNQGDSRAPGTWMALGAGWSGGSIAPPEYGVVPPAPYQTARAIRAGLLIAMARIPNEQIPGVMKVCIESGIELVVGRHT